MKKNPIAIEIGQRIRKIREERQFSQEGFADYIKLDRSNYGAIERGARNISIYTLARIAVGLNVEMAALCPNLDKLYKLFKEKN